MKLGYRALGCRNFIGALCIFIAITLTSGGCASDPRVAEWKQAGESALRAYDAGHYSEAAEKYSHTVELARAFGPQDDRLATSLNGLAVAYLGQHKYNEAEPPAQESLEIYEKIYGPNDYSVAAGLNAVAIVKKGQGKRQEAELLLKRALAIVEQLKPLDYRYLVKALNNLSALYIEESRYDDAEPLCTRAVATANQMLDSKDPALAIALVDLGDVYRARLDFARAEPLYVRALNIHEARGMDDPASVETLRHYAALLTATGRSSEATQMRSRADAVATKFR